ncbi:MAG: ABC transporter ATP-binding protein [Methylobacteriaceae bacterium]|nr:ABC transporter ATP-binding protein [Methylobacteriaceae bacterium]
MPTKPFVEITELTKTFFPRRGRPVEALASTTLEIGENEFACVVGPSGGGKSTLLNIVAGFISATSGQVLVGGKAVDRPRASRAMVFQEFALFPWLSVADNIGFGLDALNTPRQQRDEIVSGYLKTIRLAKFSNSFPAELSGGMKQRVAIARALAVDPEVLLMDEPFGALDAYTRGNMQRELLRIWEHQRKTVIFVTHSIEEAVYLADKVIVMAGRPGKVRAVIEIDAARPRDDADPKVIALRQQLRDLVLDASEDNDDPQ